MSSQSEGINKDIYKLVVVGGGPSGLGVFIRAAQTGFLPRLLNPRIFGVEKDLQFSRQCGLNQKGVALFHGGDANTFGKGNLGGYIINSNTFAKSLHSSILDEKPEMDPVESIKNTFLEEVKIHPASQTLYDIGYSTLCLGTMGNFLHAVGESLRKEMEKDEYKNASACVFGATAKEFQILSSGVIRVEVETKENKKLFVYTEHLLLAVGGRQVKPQLENPTYQKKLFMSDFCLRQDGFTSLKDHLLRVNGSKVCLVGGSHSSFSIALLLLNKVKNKENCKSSTKTVVKSIVSSIVSTVISSTTFTSKGAGSIASTSARDTLEIPSSSTACLSPKCKDIQLKQHGIHTTNNTSPQRNVVSTQMTPQNSPSTSTKSLAFKPKDITILHRNPIRCYYASAKEAEVDGVDGSRTDRSGCVNTFTGLREDARALYKDIKCGKECRVRLIQVNQNGNQSLYAKAYESADAIVWACGYATNMISGLHANGATIDFLNEHGVIKLDSNARLRLAQSQENYNEPLNIHGIGLGFSLRSAVDEMGMETRADGVTVYHRRGATLVLGSIFGTEVYGKNCTSYEEMTEKWDRKRKEIMAHKATIAAANDNAKRIDKVNINEHHCVSPQIAHQKSLVVSSCGSESKPILNSSDSFKSPCRIIIGNVSNTHNLQAIKNGNNACIIDLQSRNLSTNPPVKLLKQRRIGPSSPVHIPAIPLSPCKIQNNKPRFH